MDTVHPLSHIHGTAPRPLRPVRCALAAVALLLGACTATYRANSLTSCSIQ